LVGNVHKSNALGIYIFLFYNITELEIKIKVNKNVDTIREENKSESLEIYVIWTSRKERKMIGNTMSTWFQRVKSYNSGGFKNKFIKKLWTCGARME